MLMLSAGCLAGPPTGIQVYITGFPNARVTHPEGNGWTGIQRCFKADDGKLFYFLILPDTSYERYCTEQLKAAGISEFEIETAGVSYRREKIEPGFQPSPDRIQASFDLHYKARSARRSVSFNCMLPASSQALGQTAGFSKLERDKQVALCITSVTADMKSIADQLVEHLKHGPIEVGPLGIPYDPSSEGKRHEPSDNDYKIGFVNKTGENLYDLSVSYGEQVVCTVPDLVARIRFSYSENMTLKRPAQATLRWKTAVGYPWKESLTEHSATLQFDGVVPAGPPKGDIFLVIRDHDAVEVRPIKWGDDKASAGVIREK